MAFDEVLAQRLRLVLGRRTTFEERRMFGGLALLVRGHMCCGALGGLLIARVGPDAFESALERPHARAMDLTGKPLTGFVYVAPAGVADEGDLEAWVERALAFVDSLPKRELTRARSKRRAGRTRKA